MSVGVVVVNWNGKDLTLQFLESISEHTRRNDVELVVFDNDSDDGTPAAVREAFPEATVIAHDTNIGYVGAINEALTRIDHDYYFIANNDCIVRTEGWLDRLIETMEEHDDVGIIAPDNEPDPDVFHGAAYWNGETVDYPDGELYPKEVDIISGGQYMVEAEVFERIGLIDEIFWPAFNDEVDFCYRAQRAGYRVMFEPRVMVEHLEGSTVDEDLDKYELGRRYDIRFRWLNFPPAKLLQDLPNSLRKVGDAVLSRKGGLHVRDQWWERFKRNVRAYWWNISNLDDILEGRRVRRRVLEEGDPHTDYWTKHRQTGE